MWSRKRNLIGVAIVTVGAMALMAACETGPGTVDIQEPTLNLSANDSSIMVGESTTVFAQTANLLGRDAEINWDATMGQVEPLEGGRMARFTGDQPGTSVITAEMNVDGRVYRDRINITIDAIE